MTADKETRAEERKLTTRSTRHSKVSGQFGEILVAYLLSKEGFEVAQVDHTGLDILAVNPKSNRRLGISVKNRTRDAKSANSPVHFHLGDLKWLEEACRIFSVDPFVAAVVDRPIDDSWWLTLWLMPLSRARELNRQSGGILAFAVSPAAEMKYRALPDAHFVSWKRDEFNLDVLKR